MRFLHTADWHLGRIFHGTSLTGDQRHVLQQFMQMVEDVRPDAVIVAGDLFDRAVPPPDAVSLLDEVWHELTERLNVPVLAIAGNHDSAERTEFGARVFKHASLFVSGTLQQEFVRTTLHDEHGPVHFVLLPFAEPAGVRRVFPRADDDGPSAASVTTHSDALSHLLRRARKPYGPNERVVCIAHGSVAKSASSESERPLFVSTGAALPADAFAPFSYAALGHHHKPQSFDDDRVRYSGSLLPYSFSEASHEKSVSLIEIDAAGKSTLTCLPLEPRRRVRILEGTFDTLLHDAQSGAVEDARKQDFLKVVLTDAAPVLDPLRRLQQHYPNLVVIEQARLKLQLESATTTRPKTARRVSDVELFERFFVEVAGRVLNTDERALLVELNAELDATEREVSS